MIIMMGFLCFNPVQFQSSTVSIQYRSTDFSMCPLKGCFLTITVDTVTVKTQTNIANSNILN